MLAGAPAVAVAATMLASAAAAADLPAEKINAIQMGKTTKAEVIAALGKPDSTDQNPDGRSVFLYNYVVPVTAQNKTVSNMIVSFLFDTKDVVANKRFYTKTDAAAVNAEIATLAPPGAPVIDPLDAPAMRGMDWAGVEKSPLWSLGAAAGPKDQTLPVFGYHTLRKVSGSRLDGYPANLSLAAATDGSGRHRAVLTVITVGAEACGGFRDRLSGLYGSPVGIRRTESKVGTTGIQMSTDATQWRAGATTITEACLTISGLGHTMFSLTAELEPSQGAAPLAPRFSMTCPGLDTGQKGADGKSLAPLTFDPRDRVVRVPDGTPFARIALTDAEIAFTAAQDRDVTIDRASGAYRVSGGKAADDQHGTCLIGGA